MTYKYKCDLCKDIKNGKEAPYKITSEKKIGVIGGEKRKELHFCYKCMEKARKLLTLLFDSEFDKEDVSRFGSLDKREVAIQLRNKSPIESDKVLINEIITIINLENEIKKDILIKEMLWEIEDERVEKAINRLEDRGIIETKGNKLRYKE